MIELLESPAPEVLAIRFSGQVSAADFAVAADQISSLSSKLSAAPALLIEISPAFKKFTSTAFWDHPKLGLHRHSLAHRIGIVTDIDWITDATRALNTPDRFQSFPLADFSIACDWLTS